LYAPHQDIPNLQTSKLFYNQKEFVLQNPLLEINRLKADKKSVEAQGLSENYIPTINTDIAYQKLDDPTSYGDNYSVGISLHIPLNSANFKESEALRVSALSIKEKGIEYKIQRKNQYLQYAQTYNSATKQLEVLQASIGNYKKSEKTIKNAYLKRYVDFNTYLQTLKQFINVKQKIINQESQKNLSATIINTIASGKIYE